MTTTPDAGPEPITPTADLTKAPLPTRFVVFNARIMRMVLKGHH